MASYKPLLVYLDSSDYSIMSYAKADVEYKQCLSELIDLSKSRKVNFVFSSIVVSEMLPLEKGHISHAYARFRLLNDISTNSLIDFWQLVAEEISRALILQNTQIKVLGNKFDWLPNFDQLKTNSLSVKNKYLGGAVKAQLKEFSIKHGVSVKIAALIYAFADGGIS